MHWRDILCSEATVLHPFVEKSLSATCVRLSMKITPAEEEQNCPYMPVQVVSLLLYSVH